MFRYFVHYLPVHSSLRIGTFKGLVNMSKEYHVFGFACIAIGIWQLIMRLFYIKPISHVAGMASLILCLIIIVVGSVLLVWDLTDQQFSFSNRAQSDESHYSHKVVK